MRIEEALFTEFSGILNLRFFPLTAQQGTAFPYGVYTLTGADRTMKLTGFEGVVTATYQIDVFHGTYANLKTLKDLIVAKIKTFNFRNLGGSGPYCQSVEITEDVETYDPQTKEYQCTLDIQITFKEV